MPNSFLVIDHSQTIHKIVRLALSYYDVTIIAADSIEQGAAMIKKEAPSLIIADGSTPGMEHFDNFQPLYQQAAQCPVLILIGSYHKIDIDSFRSAGVTDIMKKPFSPSELKIKIEGITHTQLHQAKANQTSIKSPPSPASPISAETKTATTLTVQQEMTPSTEIGEKTNNFWSDRPFFPNQDIEKMIRETVEQYCVRHFAGLAKEVLTDEIRRLTTEKSRQFIDK